MPSNRIKNVTFDGCVLALNCPLVQKNAKIEIKLLRKIWLRWPNVKLCWPKLIGPRRKYRRLRLPRHPLKVCHLPFYTQVALRIVESGEFWKRYVTCIYPFKLHVTSMNVQNQGEEPFRLIFKSIYSIVGVQNKKSIWGPKNGCANVLLTAKLSFSLVGFKSTRCCVSMGTSAPIMTHM